MSNITSGLHQSLREDAVDESNFLLKAAIEFLDAQHGEGFSAKNPTAVIQLAILYELNVITSVFLLKTGGRGY